MQHYKQSDVVQHHNFFDEADFQEIKNKTGYGSKWQYGHSSYGQEHPLRHTCVPFWKIDFADDTFFTDHLLNKIQQKLGESYLLHNVYANGHTYGQDGSMHVDANDDRGKTLLLYVNPIWDLTWGGSTHFFLNEGEIHSVVPEANKAVFFPGTIRHCAAPITRAFKFLRVTLAFKLYAS
jgi:hypothetical protein